MYVWASYGSVDGLSPCARPGYGHARLVSLLSCENIPFSQILVSMHTELVWAFRRLIFVEI